MERTFTGKDLSFRRSYGIDGYNKERDADRYFPSEQLKRTCSKVARALTGIRK